MSEHNNNMLLASSLIIIAEVWSKWCRCGKVELSRIQKLVVPS